MDSHKMLMGLNFYGNYFKAMGQGGPVIGHEYLEILDRERPRITWNSEASEHLATVKDKQDATKRHLLVRDKGSKYYKSECLFANHGLSRGFGYNFK